MAPKIFIFSELWRHLCNFGNFEYIIKELLSSANMGV